MTGILITELKNRLREELPGSQAHILMAPEQVTDLPRISKDTTGKAGVLILLFPRKGELSIALIKRTEYPGPHSGQISLPGGKSEKDDRSLIITALREAREETGIETENIEIVGTLTPLYIPVSDLEVLPVVGYSEFQPDFEINTREVEYIILMPLKFLLSKENKKIMKTLNVRGESVTVPGFLFRDEYIWGATAMILSEFREILLPLYNDADQDINRDCP